MDQHDSWGMDLFKINELTYNKPLTAIVYSIFQVSQELKGNFFKLFQPELNQMYDRLRDCSNPIFSLLVGTGPDEPIQN